MANDDTLRWNPAGDKTTEHENRIFSVERHPMRRVSSPATDPATDFFVMHTPSWVNVVALTEADELVMIEQWRHGVGHTTLEIPGGIIDEGEPPFLAAKRELLEETGFESSAWFSLGDVEPNPAIIDNRCHTYLALGATKTKDPSFDENENCALVLHPFAEIESLVARGRITHALVVVALYYERLRRDGKLAARAET